MSDLISVENVNSVISHINEDNKSYKSDKSYNIEYDINERLKFLQNKYKDYEFKIIKNILKQKKKGTKRFQKCCINFDCIKQSSFCIESETKATHCGKCSKLAEEEENIEMININAKKCIKCKEKQACFCKKGETKLTHCGTCRKIISEEQNII